MLCLSVRQPWAALIVAGVKPIENRTWQPHDIGRMLIHASKQLDKSDAAQRAARLLPASALIHFGALIGSVRLRGCERNVRSRWADPDQFHWLLEDAQQLDPLASVGRLGLYYVHLHEAVLDAAHLPGVRSLTRSELYKPRRHAASSLTASVSSMRGPV